MKFIRFARVLFLKIFEDKTHYFILHYFTIFFFFFFLSKIQCKGCVLSLFVSILVGILLFFLYFKTLHFLLHLFLWFYPPNFVLLFYFFFCFSLSFLSFLFFVLLLDFWDLSRFRSLLFFRKYFIILFEVSFYFVL